VIISIGAVLALSGCISSEETGAGDRAKNPVQIYGEIDTSRQASGHDVNNGSKRDTAKLSDAGSHRVAPKFKSKQDTVQASVVKISKQSSQSKINIEHAEHSYFTVQIGAFKQASNALQVQKRAKEQFVSQPVFNRFVKRANRYLVSIGRYKKREDAFALCDTMKLQYPKEYDQCWINFIP